MITDRDICMAAQIQSRSLEELWVRDAMTKVVYACNPGDSLVDAQAIMQEARVRRLPVVDKFERVLGVVSLADLARETERQRDALSAQIGAARFGLVASRIRGAHRVGRHTQVVESAHVPQSSVE
jgi:CBS domain-containing protein